MAQINLNNINWSRVINLIFGLIILILFSSLYTQCENNKTTLAANKALTSEIKEYRLKTGELVKSQEIAVLEKETLKKNIIEKDSQLKEMSKKFLSITQVQTVKAKISLPKSEIKFDQPITSKEIDSTGELKFSRNGAKFDKWYEFGYVVTQDSLTIEPFSTWTEIKRVDGFKKKWFLGRKTYHSDIMFTNPYINTEEIKTYQVAIPVKWYETRAFNISVGIGIGTLLNKL